MFCFFPRKLPNLEVRITLLDGPDMVTEIGGGEKGESIMAVLVDKVDLRMPEFFGFKYLDKFKNWHWLNLRKSLYSQLKHSEVERRNVLRGTVPYRLYLGVQFYPRDPCKIEHERTRYHIFLQVKRDLIEGRLQVETNLFVTLGALILQSDCGDFIGGASQRESYVRQVLPMSRLSRELEQQLKEAHAGLQGRQPAEVEYIFLEKVRWLDTYGALPFPVKDEQAMYCMFEITPFGLLIDRPPKKPNIIYWPRVASFSQRNKVLMVKVKDQKRHISYSFESGTKELATTLYKACLEHFAFFKVTQERSSRYTATTMMPVKSVASRGDPLLGGSWDRINETHSDATSVSFASAHTAPSQFVRQSDPLGFSQSGVQSRPYASDMENEHILSLSDSGVSPGGLSQNRRRLLPTPRGRPYNFTPSPQVGPGGVYQARSAVLVTPSQPHIGSISTGLQSDTALLPDSAANRRRNARKRVLQSASPAVGLLANKPHGHHSRQPPQELLQHIRYEPVDPASVGLSEAELKSIPYTNISTNTDVLRVRYSPKMKLVGKVHAKAGPPPAEILPQSSGPVASGASKVLLLSAAPSSQGGLTSPRSPPVQSPRPGNAPSNKLIPNPSSNRPQPGPSLGAPTTSSALDSSHRFSTTSNSVMSNPPNSTNHAPRPTANIGFVSNSQGPPMPPKHRPAPAMTHQV